jgi:hypothetical protein
MTVEGCLLTENDGYMFPKTRIIVRFKILSTDHSSAMNMPSTKLQRKPARTAERARTKDYGDAPVNTQVSIPRQSRGL